MITVVSIFGVFIAPLWLILHYCSKRRRSQGLTSENEELLSKLWQLTDKMESRINTLETILDDQAPNWRGKA